ncbi:hypothetical protein DH2020_014698 [Rehmannia glutinosa]|uniref:Uncharacterized protein n=1 Tax=Rehmannia glutinosa TaxID=99300 RepID=A0ABR0WX72_REHGL
MRTSSFGSSSKLSRSSHELQESSRPEPPFYGGGGAMLPVYLNDLRRNVNNGEEMVEVTLELDDNSVVLCSVAPAITANNRNAASAEEDETPVSNGNFLARSASAASRLRRMFSWRRTASARTSTSDAEDQHQAAVVSAREMMKRKAKMMRTKSSAQRALGGLRFMNKSTAGESDPNVLWKQVEARFNVLAKDGLLSRQDFGECIGMGDSKEFAVGVFDALARRRRQKTGRIAKAELHDFWLQISDDSFDARLQIFFDMADINGDGKITRDEVQELIMLSASANKLSNLKERAKEYASLIMEELDPEHLGYIELWQLETLLLQRDNYMNYSRPLSTESVGWSQNLSSLMVTKIESLLFDNWQRGWILLLWILAMAGLFTWKFLQYRQKSAFHIMGYCLTTAKGAAETLKLNMALILLPVCRNILTWLRSTKARLLVPFDDNINFHKVIACAISMGVMVHAGIHLSCDFPRLVRSSPEKFELIASDFHGEKPTYTGLLTGVVGTTGIGMVILMIIAFTLATRRFRRNAVKLPPPLNRITGFNAFWHPFSLTSAPGDNYLSVHIRTVGDWTKELKRVFTEDNSSTCVIGRAKFGAMGNVNQTGLPKLLVDGPYGAPAQDYQNYDVLLLVGLGIGATPFISILKDLLNNTKPDDQMDSNTETSRSDDSSNSIASSSDTSSVKKKSQKTRSAHFYWVTRESGSFEWFKGVMNEIAEMDHKGQIEMHNYLTSVYEEGDARSTLITMVQALNHAKHGVDILSGTRVRTHFARPNWKEVFNKVAAKYPCSRVGKEIFDQIYLSDNHEHVS